MVHHTVPHRVRFFVVASALWVSACTADSTPQAYAVRDSVGIEIVETGPPLDDAAREWTISPVPALQIGEMEGADPYLFTWVWDAARTPDGRVIAVDGDAYDIRVFDSDGTHQVSFGRRGGGPREFGGPPWISLRLPDTLVVWDPGHHRLSRYTLTGTLLDQTSFVEMLVPLSMGGFNATVWQTTPDGTVLWTGPKNERPREGLMDQVFRCILIHGERRAFQDCGTHASGQISLRPSGQGGFLGIPNPFAPRSSAALGLPPNRLSISDAERWEVRSFDDNGVLHRILRARIPRKVVTRDLMTRERAKLLNRPGMGLSPGAAADMVNAFPVPDSLRAIHDMFWDQVGNLWASSHTGEMRGVDTYHVFGPDGRWLASVAIPDGMGRIFEVGDDYLLASWEDENEVQYLRVNTIEKSRR